MNKKRKTAVTLVEVIIVAGLFSILMLAVYRLFFAEVKTIRKALEHIGINESARKFFMFVGNDIRNSNWVDYPKMVNRQVVGSLKPINDGKVCTLIKQSMDFEVKPPQPDFLQEEVITYNLKKVEDGTCDLYRHVVSNVSGQSSKEYEKKICDGIVDMMVYVTNRKPVTIGKSAINGNLNKLMNYEPYELDGTGPYLVHVYASFIRKGMDLKDVKSENAIIRLHTCFAIRGKLNGIHP